MTEQQWNGVLDSTSLPNEMDIQFPKSINVDWGMKLRDLVELLLCLPPVPFFPGLDKSLHVREGNTKVPS